MSLETTAREAVSRINKVLSTYNLADGDKDRIRKIIEDSIINTVEQTTDTHNETTKSCCGPKTDLAHKITEEVERNKQALISNLMALR